MSIVINHLNSEFPPRTVTAPDPDGSAVPQYVIAGAQSIRVGATTDTPGARADLSLYFLTWTLQPLAVVRLTFAAKGADWGKTCVATPGVATPGYDASWPACGAHAVAIKVDSLSAGTWTIGGSVG